MRLPLRSIRCESERQWSGNAMSLRILTILSGALGLACAGCVVQPPPRPAMMVSPAAPQAAQAPATCREFQQTITVGGTAQEAYGTSCLQPDGSWKVVGAPPSPLSPPQMPPPPIVAVPAYPIYAYAYPYYSPAYLYPPPVYGGAFVRGHWR
jgi:hypothetical protein